MSTNVQWAFHTFRFSVMRAALATTVSAVVVATILSACAVKPASGEVAFVRNGQLWMVQSDGTGARTIGGGFVIGYSWSPNHHQLVYRTSNSSHPVAAAGVFGAPDTSGNLTTISVNGGYGIQISPDAPALDRSDAWWNPDGSRLLYRQEYPGTLSSAEFVVSQSDQPLGIAAKSVDNASAIPVLSPDGASVAVIDGQGNVLVGHPGSRGLSLPKMRRQHCLSRDDQHTCCGNHNTMQSCFPGLQVQQCS